ncbi:DUF2180 family protein [Streptomyces sp. BE133]|uniref:DUF2180 family protein n=1 Tax=Streptomyces sp. BE133 TaxID=3002523 RepID=UPI003FA685A4
MAQEVHARGTHDFGKGRLTHCLDCRTAGTNSTTVGVCQSCGAGVCAAHARTAPRNVRRGSLIGSPGEAEARTVLCPVCAAAEAPAAAALCPRPG